MRLSGSARALFLSEFLSGLWLGLKYFFAPKATIKPSKYQGAFQVQVGAFTSEAETENRLGMVQQRASDLLDGHMPFTTSFMRADEEWYRARFAGFSRKSAQAACAALKKMSLDCAVMKAE